ncbi:recombinase zinc beta ribbon domain-containing protein [Candidatus Nomurabacteria bacterium]|nr:recombinase zinc beta ribbon domain-containing protein [Candidatus Nomurabacteria bacterium]
MNQLFPPTLFEAVQKVLASKARAPKRRNRHDFPFLGLFRCGECGGMFTAQHAKGNGGIYRYYRCTKKHGACSQGYVQEKTLLHKSRIGFKQHHFAMSMLIGCWRKLTNGSTKKLTHRKVMFKIFPIESKRTRSAWKNWCLRIWTAIYQRRFILRKKTSLCALSPL